MVFEGEHTINYILNGKNKRIHVKVKLKPIKGLMKPRQALWYAEATLNGRKINHSDLEGCVNAPFLHVILEDCRDKIDCYEVTNELISEID